MAEVSWYWLFLHSWRGWFT